MAALPAQHEEAPALQELPDEVLALCLAHGLSSPHDLASVARASPRLHAVSRAAPVHLRLRQGQLPGCTPAESRRELQGVWSCFPGAAGLDASGCPLEDADVAQLVARLPRLRTLLLSGCKKLTAAASKSVFPLPRPAGGQAGSAAPQLATVVMQRCFQLTPEALTDALLAGVAARPGSCGLAAVALSHLDLRSWPQPGAPLLALLVRQAQQAAGSSEAVVGAPARPDDAPLAATGPVQDEAASPAEAAADLRPSAPAPAGDAAADLRPPTPAPAGDARATASGPLPLPPNLAQLASASPRGLRLLALHNCTGVTITALQALARACPRLEALFLGGSGLALQEAQQPAPEGQLQLPLAAAGGADAGGGDGSAGQLCPAIELAPGEALGQLPDGFSSCCGSMNSVTTVRAGARAALGALRLARFADPVMVAAAAELATLAALLPRLQVVELSFGLPGMVPLLQDLAAEGTGAGGTAAACTRVLFWDLCQPDSVRQALAWRRTASGSASGAVGGEAGGPAPPEAELFLRAAANCSSGGKVTPLHVAAEEGRSSMAQDLLSLGADVLARDRSGASPLFRACEAGHVGTAQCLLRAGADVTRRNSAGEAPLYIAALRGHGDVVRALLQHCQAAGVRWEDPQLYGDGWTPLMASAVGRHTSIAQQLLAAAGPLARPLVLATNRYGQTGVHIAARRGSWELVQCLVEAGGARVTRVADCNGRTAADIARRNSNAAVLELLRAYMGEGSGAAEGVEEEEGGRRGRGRRAKKAAAAGAGLPASLPPLQLPPAEAAPAAAAASSGQWVGRRLGARKSQAAGEQ